MKVIINNMTIVDIASSDTYNYCINLVGCHDKLNFLPLDCNNIVEKRHTEFLKKGDGYLLWEFLSEKGKQSFHL